MNVKFAFYDNLEWKNPVEYLGDVNIQKPHAATEMIEVDVTQEQKDQLDLGYDFVLDGNVLTSLTSNPASDAKFESLRSERILYISRRIKRLEDKKAELVVAGLDTTKIDQKITKLQNAKNSI